MRGVLNNWKGPGFFSICNKWGFLIKGVSENHLMIKKNKINKWDDFNELKGVGKIPQKNKKYSPLHYLLGI